MDCCRTQSNPKKKGSLVSISLISAGTLLGRREEISVRLWKDGAVFLHVPSQMLTEKKQFFKVRKVQGRDKMPQIFVQDLLEGAKEKPTNKRAQPAIKSFAKANK